MGKARFSTLYPYPKVGTLDPTHNPRGCAILRLEKERKSKMTNYQITIVPLNGEARVVEYPNAERFSVMVHSYNRCGIKIQYDPSLMVEVETRLPRNANYVGD